MHQVTVMPLMAGVCSLLARIGMVMMACMILMVGPLLTSRVAMMVCVILMVYVIPMIGMILMSRVAVMVYVILMVGMILMSRVILMAGVIRLRRDGMVRVVHMTRVIALLDPLFRHPVAGMVVWPMIITTMGHAHIPVG